MNCGCATVPNRLLGTNQNFVPHSTLKILEITIVSRILCVRVFQKLCWEMKRGLAIIAFNCLHNESKNYSIDRRFVFVRLAFIDN